jgi:hypothetical protein
MKIIFLNLCYRLCDLVYHYTGFKFSLLNIFNFNIIIFLIFICYNYLNGLDIYFIISFFISCLLSYFVLGGFKSSENIFINYLNLYIKNFLVLSILVCIYFVCGVYFEFLGVIECSSEGIPMNIDNSDNNNNKSIKDVININSGSDGDGKEYYNFKVDKSKDIGSPLEDINLMKNPLEEILNETLTFNILILIVIFLIILLIFNKFIIKQNSSIIIFLVNKYIPDKLKYKKYIVELLERILSKSKELSNKFIVIMFIINSILLISMVLINIYMNVELINNLDDYVIIYIYIKKKKSSILLLISSIEMKRYKEVKYLKNNTNNIIKINNHISKNISDIKNIDKELYYKIEFKDKYKGTINTKGGSKIGIR